jgi:CheY-specific phosphatase CheX
MFFSLPEPCEEAPDNGWDLYASVKLEGPEELTLHIFLPKRLAIKLTADFLGKEHDEVTVEVLQDMMKEMVNMIGGNLLTRLDSSTHLSLGIPESRFVSSGDLRALNKENQIVIQMGDGFMAVAWSQK